MAFDSDRFRDGDPLREGMGPLDEARSQMREAVLAVVAGEPPRSPGRRGRQSPLRSVILSVAVLVVVLAWTGARLWSPEGTATVQAAQVRFEVRLAEDTAVTPGLIPSSLMGTTRVLYLHRDVLVTNADVAQTGVIAIDGDAHWSVRVEFTPAGAERLRRATTTHLGKPVAILLDGQLALAPTLRSPIADTAVISGDYTREAAEQLAAGIARQ